MKPNELCFFNWRRIHHHELRAFAIALWFDLDLKVGCQTLVVRSDLMNRMVLTQKRGQRISFSSMCLICHTPLLQQLNDHQSLTSSLNNQSAASSSSEGAITAFNCSHSFHSDCLALQQLNSPQGQTGMSKIILSNKNLKKNRV